MMTQSLNMRTFQVLCATVILMIADISLGVDLDASLIHTSGEPSLSAGKFYGYRTPSEGPGDLAFSNVWAFARKEHAPLVVVWSHESCHYCDAFIESLNAAQESVKGWMSTNRAVFAFFKATGYNGLPHDDSHAAAGVGMTEPKACFDAWKFAQSCGSQYLWPLVAFCYETAEGEKITWGYTTPMSDVESRKNCGKDLSWLTTRYSSWVAANGIPDYFGGMFENDGKNAEDRYEAEPGTVSVAVRLVRDPNVQGVASRNDLKVLWCDNPGEVSVMNIVWSVGETEKTVDVSFAGRAFALGTIGLELYDSEGGLRSTSSIACIDPENSAGNPKWLGEPFGFGEWTMDFVAATQMVANTEGEAYTLVSVQGSKWCPDCANVERNFLAVTNALGVSKVEAWAALRNVALVAVDIPNLTGPDVTNYETPTLLSRVGVASALARVKEFPQSGAEAYLTNKIVRSGLGYLSRKGVDDATAAAVLVRNHTLAVVNTDKGGFHRPEDGNKYRTGVPIFVLLRKDGSVAARLTRMAAVSPMAADQAKTDVYLQRFEEMLAIAANDGSHADVDEIENNYPGAGAVDLDSNGGVGAGELSHTDMQDVFLLKDADAGTEQNVKVFGLSGALVKLSFCSVDEDGTVKAVASTKGPLSSSGVSLSARFTQSAAYYVKVEGYSITDSAFALEQNAQTFNGYTIAAHTVLVPVDKTSVTTVPSDCDEIVMRVESNVIYRLTGVQGDTENILVAQPDMYVPSGSAFLATADGDVTLKLTTAGATVEFQRWAPGEIAFETEFERVFELGPTGIVTIVRTGGGSGSASVVVHLVDEDETAKGRYQWTDQILTWADGEFGAKFVGFAPVVTEAHEGDGAFRLVLQKDHECCAVVSALTNSVIIFDTDAPCLEKTEYVVSTFGNFSSTTAFRLFNAQGGRITLSTETPLPTGMKLTYDADSGSVVLSGVPRKPGIYEIAVTVSERRSTGRSTGPATVVKIVVADPVALNALTGVKRPAQKVPLYVLTNGIERLAGTLDVAITSAGKISAKYAGTETKTLSFSGNWSSFDEDGSTVRTVLASKSAELELAMDDGGCLAAVLQLPEGYNRLTSDDGFLAATVDWPETGIFESFDGTYTVELPQTGDIACIKTPRGVAFMMLKMAGATSVRNGTVRYAGALPDGTAFSGSTTLQNVFDDDDGLAELCIFHRTSRNVFGIVSSLRGNGEENWKSTLDANRHMAVVGLAGTESYLLHTEAAWSYDRIFDVHGSYYVEGVSPLILREMFYDRHPVEVPYALTFDVTGVAESERYGAVESMPSGLVWASAKKLALDKTKGLSFSFNSRTGIFSGSAQLVFANGRKANGTYRGIVVPGWVDAESCCGAETYRGPVLPFGRGVFAFRDSVGGKSVVRSLPVVLDIAEVEK